MSSAIETLDQRTSFARFAKCAQIIALLGFLTTSIFCSALIYLTVFKVKRSFGSYKLLLVLFPAVGILFATVELILYPNVYSHNAGYVFYTAHHPFDLGKQAVTWLLAFYSGVYACTMSMLSVQFLYRYWAIFEVKKLRYFKGWRFLICVAYSVAFGVQWAFGLYYFDEVDEFSKHYMEAAMIQRYGLDFSNISAMTLVAYNTNGTVRWFNVSCTLNMTSIMLVQYLVIIYCAIWMYIGMEEKLRSLSLSMRNLHKQLFKTLILQIVTPTISLFSPALFIIYLPFLDLKVDLPTGISLCAFTLYPAMDAIIVLYIVGDYEKAAKLMLKKALEKAYDWLDKMDDESTDRVDSVCGNAQAAVN